MMGVRSNGSTTERDVEFGRLITDGSNSGQGSKTASPVNSEQGAGSIYDMGSQFYDIKEGDDIGGHII